MKDRTRVTVDLSDEAYAMLSELEKKSGTKANAIRTALKLYSFIVNETRKGANLYTEKNGVREIVVLL